MTFHSWCYNHHFYVINASTISVIRRKYPFDYFSSHMLYVINIITNQGNKKYFNFTIWLGENVTFY